MIQCVYIYIYLFILYTVYITYIYIFCVRIKLHTHYRSVYVLPTWEVIIMLTRLTKIYTSSLPELVFTRFRVNLLPEQSEEVLPQETASFLFFSNARNWILRLSDSLILQIYTNEMNKSQHIYSI